MSVLGLCLRINVSDLFYYSLGCVVRNSEFTISVRNSSGQLEECAYQHDIVYNTTTLTCHTPLVGTAVEFVRKPGSPHEDFSTLCEFIAMGHGYTGNVVIYKKNQT